MWKQSHYEPLSNTSLYLIHTHKYDKPYSDEVKQILEKYKNLILNLIESKQMNEDNILDINFIHDAMMKHFKVDYILELVDYEYKLAFEDLMETNDKILDMVHKYMDNID